VWLSMRPATVGAIVLLVAGAALLVDVGRPAPAIPAAGPTSVVVEMPNEAAPVVDDPSLSFVADLAADLDWETAREAVLVTAAGVSDDALSELSSAERSELHRLLKGELSPSRRGA
jgi:hypothetical protein